MRRVSSTIMCPNAKVVNSTETPLAKRNLEFIRPSWRAIVAHSYAIPAISRRTRRVGYAWAAGAQHAAPLLGRINVLGEHSRTRGGRARARGQRPIAAGAGFLDGFQRFGGGHQRGGLLAFHGAAGGERYGDGRGADIIGHFRNDDDVVFAKREKRIVDASAEFFDRSAHCFDAVLGISNEPGPGFRRVAHWTEVMWHGFLLNLRGSWRGQWPRKRNWLGNWGTMRLKRNEFKEK